MLAFRVQDEGAVIAEPLWLGVPYVLDT